MYLRAVHADATVPMLRKLIRDNPLGILTTAIPSKSFPLLQSTHIPFVLDVQDETSETELGVLRGHLARANPQSKCMIEACQTQMATQTHTSKAAAESEMTASPPKILEQEVMVLFNSPVAHYVTPKFYIESKPETGKVVPTWNYAAAAAYGRAKIYFDTHSPETTSFLSKQIDDLTAYAEESIMGYDGEAENPRAWKVSDAPNRFIQLLQKSIIGIEIVIDRLEGKYKMSQETQRGDRQGVIQGFTNMGSEVGNLMAETVRQRGELKEAKKVKAF